MNEKQINDKIESLRQEQDTLEVASPRWFEINDEIEDLISQRTKLQPVYTPTDAQMRTMDWVMSDDYDD